MPSGNTGAGTWTTLAPYDGNGYDANAGLKTMVTRSKSPIQHTDPTVRTVARLYDRSVRAYATSLLLPGMHDPPLYHKC